MSCKLKLKTTAEQTKELFDFSDVYRKANNYVCQKNHDGHKDKDGRWIHETFYYDIRERFGLSSQHAINVVRETTSLYKTLWSLQKKELNKPPEKRKDHFKKAPERKSLMVQYTLNRSVIVYPESQTINITVLDYRIKDISFSGFKDHIKALKTGKMGDPKLWFDRKKNNSI